MERLADIKVKLDPGVEITAENKCGYCTNSYCCTYVTEELERLREVDARKEQIGSGPTLLPSFRGPSHDFPPDCSGHLELRTLSFPGPVAGQPDWLVDSSLPAPLEAHPNGSGRPIRKPSQVAGSSWATQKR